MLLAVMSLQAECFMTISEGDSLRIRPLMLGGVVDVPVSMNLDYRADNFNVMFTYPEGFMPHDLYNTRCMDAGAGLTINYVNYTGEVLTYTPYLNIGEGGCSASAYIPVTGYYDYNQDGVMEPFGSAKWEPGRYDEMFIIHFWADNDFRDGDITLDGSFSAGYDRRGGTVGDCLQFYKAIHVWVGYIKGDCDGNEAVQMGDLSTLINYLLTGEGMDEFGIIAADFDSNGSVDMDDLTKLTNYLLTA